MFPERQHAGRSRELLETGIAAKNFITTYSRKSDFKREPRGSEADEKSIETVDSRLVHSRKETAKLSLKFLPSHPRGVMLGPKLVSEPAGQTCLIVECTPELLKSQCKGMKIWTFSGSNGGNDRRV